MEICRKIGCVTVLFIFVFIVAPMSHRDSALGADSGTKDVGATFMAPTKREKKEIAVKYSENWHQLYVPGGGYWKKRIGIDVGNQSSYELMGEPISLKVGKNKGEIDLAGVEVREIRVCDDNGNEFLFNIVDLDGKFIQEGKVPEGAQFIFPIELKVGEEKRYYVYFDNPKAWPVPEFWEVTIGTANSGFEEDGWWDWRNSQRVTDKSYSGKASVKLTSSGKNSEGPFTPMLAVPQDRNFIGKISFYYNAEITRGTYYVSMFFFDKRGNPITGVRGPGDPHSHIDIFHTSASSIGWKKFTCSFGRKGTGADFTIPEETEKIRLRGCFWATDGVNTGIVWLDDFVIEGLDKPSPSVTVKVNPVEESKLKVAGENAKWFEEKGGNWEYRVPVEIINTKNEYLKNVMVMTSMTKLKVMLGKHFNESSMRITDPSGKVVSHFIMDDKIFFVGNVPAMTIVYYYIYLSKNPAIKTGAGGSYEQLLSSKANLVQNPDFEDGSSHWRSEVELGKEGGKAIYGSDPNVKYELSSPGKFGKYCVKMDVGEKAPTGWRGWRQEVPVKPNTTYLYAGYVKTEDIVGQVSLHAHLHDSEGKLCGVKYLSTRSNISGTNDWQLLSMVFTTPPEIASVELHLTMDAKGKLWHDGIVLCEVIEGIAKDMQYRTPPGTGAFMVWPVNPIVKVFQDDIPQDLPAELKVQLARNEKEPLQICLRSTKILKNLEIKVDTPRNASGDKLENVRIDRVGYVPVDVATNYFSSSLPPWRRIIPTGDTYSDGWAGWWPDPLLPAKPFDLEPGKTQPLLITFATSKNTKPGDYTGTIKIVSEGKILKTIPLKVTVWNFELSNESHLTALFDLKNGPGWNFVNSETRPQWYKFMSEYRVCADNILPCPEIKYKNGQVTLETAEFDRAASYYFDELKMRIAYLPLEFYSFGWGFEPKPYKGFKYPSPEYKDAYQKCLKALWEHLKSKGWGKKFILYISDEPHFYDKEISKRIIEQMQWLCNMIHEVSPEIKIYSSTWRYCPEWDGYLDVWGVGSYGCFPVEEMEKQVKKGKTLWFTTDGQMCLTTPYCAIERLLPYYCFKYGVSGYEFWGFSWWTFNPYKFGWHRYLPHVFKPGDKPIGVRYPSIDGFLAYPGWLIGEKGPLSSIRLEQVREGMEDYEYMYILKTRIEEAKKKGKDTATAEKVLQKAMDLVSIPNAGGTKSTKILPNPDAIFIIRNDLAQEIMKLGE